MRFDQGFQDCKFYALGEGEKIHWLRGVLIQAPHQENFPYGYTLYIPDDIHDQATLIVEGSNVGKTLSQLEEAKEEILREGLYPSLPIFEIANELGLPVLYPLFPRVWNGKETIYNHMLATNSLDETTPKLKEYQLDRVDLQLLNMVEDARRRCKACGIELDEKFIIDGFSASAKFANRFAVLHPEAIKMCIAGGVSGILTLPAREYNGEKLLWPVGVGNIEKLIGEPYSDEKIEQFKQVKQIYYMGGQDNNNPFIFNEQGEPYSQGMINKDGLEQVERIFGHTMEERWVNAQKLYQQLGVYTSFYTYDNVGHNPRPARQDILLEIKAYLDMEKEKKKNR